MKLKAHSPLLNSWTGTARIATKSSASGYGFPVLTIAGEPVDLVGALLADYELLKSTERERDLLRRAGYSMRGL
jgi:hypothetical protein